MFESTNSSGYMSLVFIFSQNFCSFSPHNLLSTLVLVWLVVASVCRFGPRTQSTFFFYMDLLSNGRGLGCYLQLSKVGPSMGPHR